MANRGRRSKYETHVKSRFEDIKKWLKIGATEKEIANKLGIHIDTWIEYKKKYPELNDVIKENRKAPVEDIKAAMLKRALGFQYEEKKVITQKVVIDGVDGNQVPAKVIKTEITTKTALPDVAAGLVLLKHWDKDENGKIKWTGDPASYELKKQELELKKKQVENESW